MREREREGEGERGRGREGHCTIHVCDNVSVCMYNVHVYVQMYMYVCGSVGCDEL